MTELEKIEYAKSFIDKLANGVNPLDDSPLSENDIANHVRLSRCFFYISDILRQVIENGGVQAAKPAKQRKQEFCLSEDLRGSIQISEKPLSVSEISKHLNELIDLETTKKISAVMINQWLLEAQLLEVVDLPNGKSRKMPTASGKELGIFTEERTGQYGTYITVLFSSAAQQFIYDNLDAIIGFKHEKEDPLSEYHGRAWTEAQDACLTDLFGKNVPVSEIAFALKRTDSGIRARLKRLGLIENRSDAK